MILAPILPLFLGLCTFDSASVHVCVCERERDRFRASKQLEDFQDPVSLEYPLENVSIVPHATAACGNDGARSSRDTEKERLALKAFAERETCVRNGPRPRSRRVERIVEERSAAFFRTIDARQNFLSLSLYLSLRTLLFLAVLFFANSGKERRT